MAQEELVAVIRAELNQFKQTFDQANKILRESQAAATAALKQAQAQETALVKEGQAAQLAALRQGQAAQLAAIHGAKPAELAALKDAQAAETATIKQGQAAATAALKEGQATQLAALKQGQAAETAATRAHQQSLLEAARQAGRQRVQEARDANRAVQQETSGFQRVLAGTLSVAGGLGIVKGITDIVAALKDVAKESIATATRMQSLTAAFTLISGGAGKAQNTLAFLRDESTRLGIDFVTSAESFKRFDAAARGTALEGEKARAIFTAISQAMRVIGGTSDQTRGALVALEQIISKGKVSSEELRSQLSEHLPGAFQISARAMGVTTAELGKMLETTDLLATEFIPKFAAQLQKEFGPGVEAAAQTAQATFAKLGNEVQALGASFGQSLLNILKPTAGFMDQLLRQIREATAAQEALAARTLETALAGKPVIGGAQSFVAAAPEGATAAERARLLELTERQIIAERTLADVRKLEAGGGLGALLTNVAYYEKRAALAEKQLKDEEALVQARIRATAQGAVELDQLNAGAEAGAKQATATVAYKKQVEEVLALHKQLPGEVEKAVAQAKLLGGSFSAAEVELTVLRKQAIEVTKLLNAKPTLLLDPQIKAQTEALRERIAVLVKTVEAEKEQAATGKRTSAEAVQAAKQRVETEKGLQADLIRLREDGFEVERQLLARKLDDLRTQGVAETTIAAIGAETRQDILRREVEEALKRLEQEQAARDALSAQDVAHSREIAEAITALEAKESRTRVDDFKASLAAKREALRIDAASPESRIAFDLAAERATQRLLTEEEEKGNRDRQRETERALKEQQREYEQTYGRIADRVSSIFQGLLNRTIRSTRDLLDIFKDLFFKTLSDIAARALTQAIIVPVVAQGAGLVGGLFGGGTGGGGGGTGGALLGLGGTAQQVSGALGGPTLASLGSRLGATVLIPGTVGTGAAGAGALTAFPSGGFAAGGSLAPSLYATQQGAVGAPLAVGGTAGLTLGGAIAGVGAGVGTGFGLRSVNDVIGITGLLGKRGSSAFAGAGGGALGGALLGAPFGPIGSAVGAIAGTLLGALGGGLLGGGKKERIPELTLLGANAPRFGFDATTGFAVQGDFGISSRSRNFGQAQLPVHDAINRSTSQLLEGLASTIGGFPKELQERAVPELQRLADEFGATFKDVRFKGKDVEEQVSTFVNDTIPETFNEIFSPFIERLERVAPVLAEFDRVIAALEAQQADLLHTIDTARTAILEGPQTPAGAFQQRRALLDTLVAESAAGTPAEQAALVPAIAQLAQEVAQLSRQEGALVTFSAELRDLHTAVEVSTSALQAQEEALVASQAALDANRAALEGSLQVQEAALDEQRQASETQINALEAAVDAERATIEGALRAQEDTLKAERDASNIALRALEDTLEATEAASRAALQAEEDALDARENAFRVALQAEEDTLNANRTASRATLQALEDALDAQRDASRAALQAAEEAFEAQRIAVKASLEAEEEALDAAATALRTLEDTLQTSLRVLDTMAQSLASSREALTGARAALIDSVQGPAQLFESRKADLQALVRSLPTASLEERTAALPEIAALTQEVIQLAKQGELFGDDVAAFHQLQQQLLAQLDQAETFAQEAQAAVAAQQAELLRQEQAAQAAFAAQEAAFLAHQQAAQDWIAWQQSLLVAAEKAAQASLAQQQAALVQAEREAQAWLAAQQAALLWHEQMARDTIAAQQAQFLAHQHAAQAVIAQQEAVLVAAQQQAQAHLGALETQLVQAQQHGQAVLANSAAVLVATQQQAQAYFAAQEAQLLQAQQYAQAVLANQQAVLVQAQVAHQNALAAHDALLAQEAARTQAAQGVIQQQLVGILDTQRAGTEANFAQAIAETRAQRDIVLTTLQVNQSQEYHLANAVAYLASINSLTAINTRRLEIIGSFQTEPGQVRQIPRTGLALVHRGELIGRPGAGGDTFAPTIHLTINAPGAEPQAVAQATTQAIEQTIRELERRRRYRQTRAA